MSATTWTPEGQTTIPAILARAVSRDAAAIGFSFGDEMISYGELDRQSRLLANGLSARGVVKGDRVCTMLDNSLDAILLFYAVSRVGAIQVPVNTSFKGDFLRHQLADAQAAVLIAESDYADRILAVADDLPDARVLLHRGARPTDGGALEIAALDDCRNVPAPYPEPSLAPADLSMLIYTSGTTGPSKGCMIPHGYMCNMGAQVVRAMSLTSRDIFWTPLPLFHANAISCGPLASVIAGARCAIETRFSLSRFWPEIERTGATAISLIGSMVSLIASAPDNGAQKRCRGQLRAVSGAPFPPALKEIWHDRFGVELAGAPGYGLTEMCMLTMTPLDQPSPPGASGRVFEDYELKIIGSDGAECPPDVAGEIIARPTRPNLMFAGYWKRPDATLQVLGNLWFHTGDIGRLDADGFFTFVDRKKDYLRRGGENISSFEMEATFRSHSAIEEVAVHAVPSELSEDEVKVTAILKLEATISEADLCLWAIDRLPYFAVPRYIEFRKELPRNQVGRILKFELREEGVTSATWDRAQSDIVLVKR